MDPDLTAARFRDRGCNRPNTRCYCGYCGNKMMGATRRQSWTKKDGRRSKGVYRYYQCQSKNNQSVCGYHTWRAAQLEATVVSQLKHALKARDLGADREGTVEQHRTRVQEMRKAKVKNAERKLVQALRRAAQGKIPVSVVADYLEVLDGARAAADRPFEPSAAFDTLERWVELSIEERRQLLEENVIRVDITDDSVELAV